MTSRDDLKKLQQSLIGLSVTWRYSDYPVYTNENCTRFYVEYIYATGTIIKATANRVSIQTDRGQEGIVLKHYNKADLLKEIEDESVRQIIENTIPKPSKPRQLEVNYDIYTLSDPRTNIIHYVGISKNIEMRYRQHCQCQGLNLELNIWIQELLRQGHAPQITIIETVVGATLAQNRETYWIQHHLNLDTPLKNIAKVDREMAS